MLDAPTLAQGTHIYRGVQGPPSGIFRDTSGIFKGSYGNTGLVKDRFGGRATEGAVCKLRGGV
eukprot:1463534-Pyramimonas_sp.AAC.2